VGKCLQHNLKITPVYEYAENPYVSFFYRINEKDYKVNVVPIAYVPNKTMLNKALKISGMARTPFHTTFAQENLEGLEDEVRLLKIFTKRKKVYGIFGLTGWLCELLVLNFGSFINVLKSAERLDNAPIDILNRHTTEELKKRFPHDHVIILDPIDVDRNAAAGIQGVMGEFKLKRFIANAQEGLRTPEVLFQPLQIPYNVEITFRKLQTEIIETNLYTFLGGVIGKLKSSLLPYGYHLEDAYININKPSILLLFDKVKQSIGWKRGPPLSMSKAVEQFRKTHRNSNFRQNKGYIWIKQAPKYVTIEQAIKDHIEILKGYLKIQAINTYAMIKINNLQEEIY
ncbi:MAG: hypothetical protein ACFFDC_21400, partial [Promethearchaeota archaeon]